MGVAKVDEDPKHQGRQLLFFTHSVGSLYAYFMIKRLGDRVLKFYPVAARPPLKGAMVDAWGIDTREKLAKFDDAKILKGMLNTWSNDFLEMFRGKPAEQLPPMAKEVLDFVRRQFCSPFMPIGPKDLKALKDKRPAAFGPLAVPVLAIAGGKEQKLGETPAKVKKWGDVTSGKFDMKVIEGADHYSLLMETKADKDSCVEVHKLVAEDMKQFVK